jgi:PAS domain S-box-containing protein
MGPDRNLVHRAERDLICARFPFFVLVWLSLSFVWLYALVSGDAPLLDQRRAVATGAAELLVLLPIVPWLRRVRSSPLTVRTIVLGALIVLAFVWTAGASLSTAPLIALIPPLAAFMLVLPLFFAWSWRVELGLMTVVAVQATLWMRVVGPATNVPLVDLVFVLGGAVALGTVLAARVAGELHIRLERRMEEEAAQRALAEAHEARRESEERFRVAFHRAPIGMSMVGADGVIQQVNAAFGRMLGRSTDELVGRHVDEFIQSDDLATAHADRRQVLGGEVDMRDSVMRLRHRDGHAVFARVTRALVRDREGKPSYMIGQVEDVTERLRTEQALASSERMFRSFAESTAAGVLIVQDEIIRYVNAAVTEITGFTSDELCGTPLGNLLHPDDREVAVARAQARLRGEPMPERVEYRLRTKSGRLCWVDLTVGIIEHFGRPALLGTAFDITERRNAEEALRTSLEELREREEQLRLLAQHQVRVREEERRRLGFDLHDDVCQELVGTGIMVESVRGRLHAIDPEASQKLARVGQHLNELGEHLRLVARELRPMLLHDLGLEDSMRSLGAGMSTTARITTRVPTPIPRLGEDVEVAVYRIAQEAITNAVRHANATEIVVTLAAAEGVLTVEIRDDGRGFEVKTRQRDGLGLVSMEERALAVGGKLQVSSTPGRGTSVVLTCPLIRRVPRRDVAS